jgi:hypothetical protein
MIERIIMPLEPNSETEPRIVKWVGVSEVSHRPFCVYEVRSETDSVLLRTSDKKYAQGVLRNYKNSIPV